MLIGHSPIREQLTVWESPGYLSPFLHTGTMAETPQAGTIGRMDYSLLRLRVEEHSAKWAARGLGLQVLALTTDSPHTLSIFATLGLEIYLLPYSITPSHPCIFYFICWIPLCHTCGHSLALLHCS